MNILKIIVSFEEGEGERGGERNYPNEKESKLCSPYVPVMRVIHVEEEFEKSFQR